MITNNWATDRYRNYLERWGFNEEQIDFICDQYNAFKAARQDEGEGEKCSECGRKMPAPAFDLDGYERDMWYTMNRSGLFEKDDENKSGITSWEQYHTRRFITEVNY